MSPYGQYNRPPHERHHPSQRGTSMLDADPTFITQSTSQTANPEALDIDFLLTASPTSQILAAEIPDSQPDSYVRPIREEEEDVADLELECTEPIVATADVEEFDAADGASVASDDTKIIPIDTQESLSQEVANRYRGRQDSGKLLHCYPLHDPLFGQNGCLPEEGPRYNPAEQPKMDQSTQQNTQPIDHPRRKGANSMLSLQDEADILCVLHPSSLPALKAVELVQGSTPQHIHLNHDKEGLPEPRSNTQMNNDSEDSDSDHSLPVAPKTRVTSPDIALRMSSKVRDRRMGFVFGRNPKKCDLLIAKDTMRLSSAHFRIFVNHNGVLMLEDTSKNGTYVDSVLLRSLKADPPNHGSPKTRMLSHGSMIELPIIQEKNEEWIRFIVVFPARNTGVDAYQANLVNYIAWIKQEERKAHIARHAGGLIPDTRPMPFGPLHNRARDDSPPGSNIAAATGPNNYGMKWNGGDKYNVVGHIGQGAFAIVYKLSTVEHGVVYACKQIEKRRFIKDGQPGIKMLDEIKIMEQISHPNIVQFIEFHQTDRYMFIIMEFIPLGDLTAYTGNDMAMHEHMAQHVAAQICSALKYLHRKNIAHRDIKPDNILVASETPFVFKLSDFGLSRIVSNEDNMRTFCGTILYCAPEIYPGYERASVGMPIGKRGRHIQHPPEQTRPYRFSVDTWGIAAVLFHLLCGHPAWAGTTDDNGAVMLETIFSTPINWERLTLAGVSELAIDFLKGMLCIDPASRPTDDGVLAHPWIKQIISRKTGDFKDASEIDGLQPRGNPSDDSEDIPDASQLDLNDVSAACGIDGIHEVEPMDAPENELENTRNSTRQVPRPWEPTTTIRADGRFNPDLFQPVHSSLQDPTNTESTSYPQHRAIRAPRHGKPRLFGEIPESALRSSGVLGQNANEALDIEDSQMEDDEAEGHTLHGIEPTHLDQPNLPPHLGPESEESGFFRDASSRSASFANTADAVRRNDIGNSEISSVDENFPAPSEIIADFISHGDSAVHATSDADYCRQAPKSYGRNALSLYGAESLVKDLNMASPESATSDASATHETPASRDMSPVRQHPKRSNRHLEPAPEATSAKRSKADNAATSGRQLRNSASQDSSPPRASIHLKQREDSAKLSTKATTDTVQSSFETDEMATTVTRGYRIREDPGELEREVNNLKTKHPERLVEPKKKPYYGPPMIEANTGPNLNTVVDDYVKINPYLETPITLGVLTPTEGSIPTVPAINITNRVTCFGRDPRNNRFVHPGDEKTESWERVGKNCIDLTMWYCNIEKEIDDNALPEKWYENPKLVCLISTRTSTYIKINDVKIKAGRALWIYGKLRTGDIITVFEEKNDKQFLRFHCNFFTGASKDPRPEDGSEPFLQQTEQEEFNLNAQRRVNGMWRKVRADSRAKAIAEGRDPDAEAKAVRTAARERREKEDAESERVHQNELQAYKRKQASERGNSKDQDG